MCFFLKKSECTEHSDGGVFAVGGRAVLRDLLLFGGHAVAVVLQRGVRLLLAVRRGQLEVQILIAPLERALLALLLLDDLAGRLFVDPGLRLAFAYRATTT